jgi:hypothetical protein
LHEENELNLRRMIARADVVYSDVESEPDSDDEGNNPALGLSSNRSRIPPCIPSLYAHRTRGIRNQHTTVGNSDLEKEDRLAKFHRLYDQSDEAENPSDDED